MIASEDAAKARWWSTCKLPPLAFDHDEIYVKALEALRIAFRTRPIAFELLPKHFTLTQLQDLYEQVFGIKIKKLSQKSIEYGLYPIHRKKTIGGRHRPAMLYQYHPKYYEKYFKENLF